MLIDSLSTAASTNINEDLVTSFTHPDGTLELLVFDGASSVSDRNYLDTGLGDPAWFVLQFSAALKQVATPLLSQADSMQLALQALREQHNSLLQVAAIPCHAWPIAALTWLRVHANGEDVSIYALGDCKSFLLDAHAKVSDLDPYDNPQEGILKSAIEALQQEGLDEQARWARLLPMLRERRVSQNMHPQPSILCLYPQGRFAAREHHIKLKQSDRVLIMTDGFYRLVDSYHLYDTAGLMQACARRGLPALMQELREHEVGKSGGMAVKKADDATVAMLSWQEW
ncbi:SpoIIE family protein phosphatase [Undibacterium sp. CY18W]|uniref:SpoIIE family protein phosphatase n=1 Tax=Undibacterium hunanense TaxID=2762292 RepID=A0ABR6ZKR1_9BURK|nr:SpoIIE family protein phosphatase [Undibacterium hunanense]MBC3916490.1 SpoIIE family protein phosphatase [Undibacterium hunanense]